jgi:tyrosyl-tRNA synthetase
MYRERMKAKLPFGTHELLYPLLQGYDSVAIKADVEVGGLDQTFNLLMGREVQQAHGQEPQDVILMDYLLGTDGKEKMSKSLGNYIAITDPPAEMYGKVMSIPDKQIVPYFRLATDVTDEAILVIEKELKKANPRDIKMRLAKTIVELYHGAVAAEEAKDAWRVKFQERGTLVVDQEVKVKGGLYETTDLLVRAGLVASKSEAHRKIGEGAVWFSYGQGWTKAGPKVTLDRALTVRLGKRFVRAVPR